MREHLQKVAAVAVSFAREAQPTYPSDTKEIRELKHLFHNMAWHAGLLHDLGKYREEFQQYLKKERCSSTETAHAVYGAAAACFSMDNVAGAFAIAGHHAGLHDMSDLQCLLSGSKFNAEERYIELIRLAENEKELGSFPEFKAPSSDDTEPGKRRYELMARMLFSIVVDADRLDAERWQKERKEQKTEKPWQRSVTPLEPEVLLQQLEAERDKKAKKRLDDDLNKLRNNIFDACLMKGSTSDQGFFSLTVPTGGGKTLSSMAFALSHARRHNLRRVIVVIPYLSIIEQNAGEYRKIFGLEQVIEHHSAVELPDRKDAADPSESSDWEKATENWDAPIIVTTSVQFIETLFAASPGKARKLHNIARSVVVFDEVQTLPTHLLEPTLDVLRELKDSYAVSFLFCSATQPAFKKSANLKQGFGPDEMKEIAPDPERTYQALRRVDYHVESKDNPWDWKILAEQMVAQPQALCVVNLRQQAFALWQTMCDFLKKQGHEDDVKQGLFHLSSAMCPAHRLDLLGLSKDPPPNNVKARLKAGKPCWVVSTQLIEAGVDIDFPVVFRAMGPLDSIVQAAGRCNREGQLKDEAGNLRRGKVIVFSPEDGGLPPGIYERATNIAAGYLDPDRLAIDPNIFVRYFSELHQISPTDHSRKGEHSIQYDRAEFNFRRVADHAKVIKENTIAVIALYGRAEGIVKQIRKTRQFDRDTLRKLQRYMVNVRGGCFSDFAELQRDGALEPLLHERLDIPVLDKSWYNLSLGVVIQNRPLEDFIQ